MNFEFIGLQHIPRKYGSGREEYEIYRIIDKDLSEPVLKELKELYSYFNIVHNKILIPDRFLNILIKYNRINKLKILEQ